MLTGSNPGYATANRSDACPVMQLSHAHRLGYKTDIEMWFFSQMEQQLSILLRRFLKY